VNVKVGDYILAVNGRELHAADNIYSFFEGTAGKQVVVKAGANPDGTRSHGRSHRERNQPTAPGMD
jgi:tricorn protease